MWYPFRRSWFQARALGVLQTAYGQSLRNPLPPFEGQLLRGAVNITLADGGTPHDAATRFYAAFAETAVRQGRDLNEINFGVVLGHVVALANKMKYHDEHKAALKQVSDASRAR